MVALRVPPRRRLRRVEYDQMVGLGLFHGERVELFRGELVSMSPIGSEHSAVVTRLHRFFDRRVPAAFIVRSQQPLVCADESEPEPDLSIVTDGPLERAHPAAAALVVEVAASSLEYALGPKAALYAESAIAEYWVVDLEHRSIVVHRDRADGGWRSIITYAADQAIAAQLAPDAGVTLAALLHGA